MFKSRCISKHTSTEQKNSVPSYPPICQQFVNQKLAEPKVSLVFRCTCWRVGVCFVFGVFFLRSFKYVSLQTIQAKISKHLHRWHNSQNHSSSFSVNDTVMLCSWSMIRKASFGKTEILPTLDIQWLCKNPNKFYLPKLFPTTLICPPNPKN